MDRSAAGSRIAAVVFGTFLAARAAADGPPSTVVTELPPPARIVDVDGQTLKIHILGRENRLPPPFRGEPAWDPDVKDVVAVGGGFAALAAMYELRNYNVLALEQLPRFGGVSGGLDYHGVLAPLGSTYFGGYPSKEVRRLFGRLGAPPMRDLAILPPIDSAVFDQSMFPDAPPGGKWLFHMWARETLRQMPAEDRVQFEAFLKTLKLYSSVLSETPVEDPSRLNALSRRLDGMTMAEFLAPFGPKVKAYLDLFCLSALLGPTEEVSAYLFLDFYATELKTRYAFPTGSSGLAEILVQKIHETNPDILQAGATVRRVRRRADGLFEVVYAQGGRLKGVVSRKVIMTTPLNVSAHLIEGFPEDRREILKKYRYGHYIVHNVILSRDVLESGFDFWATGKNFTDFIIANWVTSRGFAGKGYRLEVDRRGIVTLYQPERPEKGSRRLSDEQVVAEGIQSFRDLKGLLPDMAKEKEITVISSRYPNAILIPGPKWASEYAPEMRKPLWSGIYFASDDVGEPSVESALHWGDVTGRMVRRVIREERRVEKDGSPAARTTERPGFSAERRRRESREERRETPHPRR